MEADFAVELGPEDECLEFPWNDPEGKLRYYDLRGNPECIDQISEAQEFPELRQFLRAVNSTASDFETAKCDVWSTTELTAEDELFGAACKCGCYVDLLFSDERRFTFEVHEQFVKKLTALLKKVPEIPARVEALVRRCYYHLDQEVKGGFYATLYVFGYGDVDAQARRQCGIGTKLMANAMMQAGNSLDGRQ